MVKSDQETRPEKSTLPNYKWIKFGIEYLNDPDFMQLSDLALAAYLKLYLVAGRADAGGMLCGEAKTYDVKDIAWLIRFPIEKLPVAMEELTKAGLLTIEHDGFKVARFLDEQGPGEDIKRQAWRARQDKHRKEKNRLDKDTDIDKELDSHGDVTVTNEQPSANHGPDPGLFLISQALSEVSGLSFEANRSRIFREAKELSKDPTATAEKIRKDYGPGGLWFQADFRGRQGSPPALNQVRGTWGTLRLSNNTTKKDRPTGFDISSKTIRDSMKEEATIEQ